MSSLLHSCTCEGGRKGGGRGGKEREGGGKGREGRGGRGRKWDRREGMRKEMEVKIRSGFGYYKVI